MGSMAARNGRERPIGGAGFVLELGSRRFWVVDLGRFWPVLAKSDHFPIQSPKRSLFSQTKLRLKSGFPNSNLFQTIVYEANYVNETLLVEIGSGKIWSHMVQSLGFWPGAGHGGTSLYSSHVVIRKYGTFGVSKWSKSDHVRGSRNRLDDIKWDQWRLETIGNDQLEPLASFSNSAPAAFGWSSSAGFGRFWQK